MTQTRVRPDSIEGVDLYSVPRCNTVYFHIKSRKILGWRFHRKIDHQVDECSNCAHWVGTQRCCGNLVLSCEDCRQFSASDGKYWCMACDVYRKPPRWVPL